ncbi:MAG: hypothetical protein U0R71_02850 [Solirubrobacterales bacterium]
MAARRPSSVAPLAALGAAALLLLATAGTAAAAAPELRPGHLPAIGAIALTKTPRGLARISVPVTYTKAIPGRARGLEFSTVTLHVARRLRDGRPVGTIAEREHRHRLAGSGTVVDRFVLGRRASRALLGAGRDRRGRLVRVDVRHRIRERRRGPAMHDKNASMTMASSHRARPQGESGLLRLSNETGGPIRTVSTPILCMYTDGEEGSNLESFTTAPEEVVQPNGTIEGRVEADGSILDRARYQGPTGESAGAYVDWASIGVDFLANMFDVELTPFALLFDATNDCSLAASTFQIVAAAAISPEAEAELEAPFVPAASSEAWVLTAQTCSRGCPPTHLISAFDALEYQGIGEEQVNPGIWTGSTPILEALSGGWRDPPVPAAAPGRIVRDEGLHWSWRELPALAEERDVWPSEEVLVFDTNRWEISVHPGSSPAGFSG